MSLQRMITCLMVRRVLRLILSGTCKTMEILEERSGIDRDSFEAILEMLNDIGLITISEEEGGILVVTPNPQRDPSLYLRNLNTLIPEDFLLFEEEAEVIENEDILDYFLKAASKFHVGDENLILINILIGLTPWIETRTLHFYPCGMSGKGKSSLCSSVLAAVVPQGKYEVLKSASPMSFYYAWMAGQLSENKIIFIDDVQANNEEFYGMLKSFAGNEHGNITPRHWTVDQHRKFLDMKPDMIYSIWLTSVTPLEDDQVKNRFIVANVDESIEQDKKVQKYLDELIRHSREREILKEKEFRIAKNVFNILTEEVEPVIIPFKISFPLLQDRRNYPCFLVLLKAIAYANKFKRPYAGRYIVALRKDFELAKLLWKSISESQSTKLSREAYKMLKVLPEDKEDALSRAEIAELTGLSTRQVGTYGKELAKMNLINSDRVDKGKYIYWLNAKVLSRSQMSEDILYKGIDEKVIAEFDIPEEIKSEIESTEDLEVTKKLREKYEDS